MTFQEVVEVLEKNIHTIGCEDFEWMYFDPDRRYRQDAVHPDLGPVKQIAHYGGEDKGSEYWNVYYLEDHDMFIKLQGYYSSYNGTDYWGGFAKCLTQVSPVEKTITVYEQVNI